MNSKMKEPDRGFFVKHIIATLCLVLICAISIAHSKYMDQKISDISKTYLSKITVQNADMLSNQISGNLQALNILTRMIGVQKNLGKDQIMNIMNNEIKNGEFISLGVVFSDGSFVFTPVSVDGKDGSNLLMPVDWQCVYQTMEGDVSLTGSFARQVNGEMISIFVRPIYRDLEIIGALVALFNYGFFENLTLPDTFEKEGCSYIAEKNGTILFHPESSSHEEFSDVIRTLSFGWNLSGESGVKLKEETNDGLSNTIEYFQNKENVYISYAPIRFHNWYLVNVTSASVAKAKSHSIYEDYIPSLIYILVILIALMIYFIYVRRENYKRLERKLRLQSINDESYRMIMEQTNDIIFEYDTIEKTYLHTANFEKTFGYKPTKTGFLGSLRYDYLHPDDVIAFVEIFEKMKTDRVLSEAEVRIINSEGEYLWTRIYTLGVFDKDGKLAKVIGKIVNIDEKKREFQYLKKMAVMDTATGVYNKQTTEDMIKDYLTGEGKSGNHALLMIDIDDFKGINDDHGHRLGDVVISTLGMELNQIFRADDIKGRIGGDEFMILMKNVEGTDFIVNKAKLICKIFQDRELDDHKKINGTTSIGIALYDKDGTTYEALYEAADRALYHCKTIQKGTFSFYDEIDKDW